MLERGTKLAVRTSAITTTVENACGIGDHFACAPCASFFKKKSVKVIFASTISGRPRSDTTVENSNVARRGHGIASNNGHDL